MLKQWFGQLSLPVVDPLGIVTALAERREQRRNARRQRASAIVQLRQELLAFGAAEQLDLFVGVMPARETDGLVPTRDFCRTIANEWSDQQIVALCDGIIRASLEGLRSFKDASRRRELLTWFAPASDPSETLSFAFCCRVAGLNPEPIYTSVWHQFKAEICGFLEQGEGHVDADVNQADLLLA
ncbi:hypothetical protein [Rhodanobacter sp. FW106-PBR-R2A-1-13]|uniref:hypothetical protein n=1 Tax=Rhodanobacter sp. FW106-PBR-R2A-1-13 TaxID=3454845 RepID=UPI0034E48A63